MSRSRNGTDTAIFLRSALRDIVEDGEVDAHDFRDWLNRIETKLDTQNTTMSAHGERLAKVEAKATAAHKRLDEGSSRRWGIWVILAGTLVATVATWIGKATGKW